MEVSNPLKIGKTVINGYIFMGNFSPYSVLSCLRYYPGVEWREVRTGHEGKDAAAIKLRWKSAWVPVQEHIDYLNELGKTFPNMAKAYLDEIGT